MIRPTKRLFKFFAELKRIKNQETAYDFLVFFQSPHLGGGHTFLKMLIGFFNETGQKVHFVFEENDFTTKVEELIKHRQLSFSLIPPVEEVYFPGNLFSRGGLRFLYRYLIRTEDFVQAALNYPAKKIIVNVGWPLSWFKAFLIPKPTFYFQHVLPRHDLDRGNLFLLKIFYRFRQINFVGVSKACSNLMKKNWKIPVSNLHTLYHYDLPKAADTSPGIQLPLKSQGGLRIMTASRVEEGKDPELWLRIAKRLTTKYPLLDFVWAGEGSYLDDMKRSSVGFDRIHWLGQVDNIRQVFESADIYFEPSKREAFGLSILEAMSFGLPVVTTRCGGPEEIVVPGGTGYLGQIEEEEELYGYLLELINDPLKISAFGSQGKKICETRFNKEIWKQGLEEILGLNRN